MGGPLWDISFLAPLASESQVVSDFTVLKRMVCELFLGNERTNHISPCWALGCNHQVLCSLLYLFTLLFFSVGFHQSSVFTSL